MTTHDWTLLDNGWSRHPTADCIIKQLSRTQAVRTADGREWQIVRERGKGMYLLLIRDGVTLSWDNEYALEAVE